VRTLARAEHGTLYDFDTNELVLVLSASIFAALASPAAAALRQCEALGWILLGAASFSQQSLFCRTLAPHPSVPELIQ